jgi:hypothetical protein
MGVALSSVHSESRVLSIAQITDFLPSSPLLKFAPRDITELRYPVLSIVAELFLVGLPRGIRQVGLWLCKVSKATLSEDQGATCIGTRCISTVQQTSRYTNNIFVQGCLSVDLRPAY